MTYTNRWKTWNSEACGIYFERIEDEVITAGNLFESILTQWFSKTGTQTLGNQKLDIMRSQNLVYLMTIVESFLEAFINEQGISPIFAQTTSKWQSATAALPILNKSISPLNMHFTQYFLFNYYPNLTTQIANRAGCFTSSIPKHQANQAFPEIGSLRDCLAHAGGKLRTKDIPRLPQTLAYFGISSAIVGQQIYPSKDYTIEMARLFQIIIWHLDNSTIQAKNHNVLTYNVTVGGMENITIK